MTLQNGMILGPEVRLYCDTAWIEIPSGKVCAFYPKALYGLAQPFAIVGSFTLVQGNGQGIDDLAQALASKEAISSAELRVRCIAWLAQFSASNSGVTRLLVGCNYPKTGPELFVISSDDLGFARPMIPVDLMWYVSSANSSEAYRMASTMGFSRERMLAIVDQQRAEKLDAADGSGGYFGIGGAAVEIIVRPDGVVSEAVRKWEDALDATILGLPARHT